MIIGVRAHDYGKMSPAALFDAISGDGWKTVQLAFPKAIERIDSFDDVTQEIVSETKSALISSNLSVAVLGVYIEPSFIDESKRKEQIRMFLNMLPHAKTLEAGCVGTETTTRDGNSDIRALYRSLEEILPEAERLAVNIGIEPVHRHTLNTPEATRQMLSDFPSPRLKIIFDPLNLLTPDTIDSQIDLWKRSIDCFGDHIIAIHMKGASPDLNNGGMLADAPFESSVLNHEALFPLIKSINAPILREGANPAKAATDIAFIKKYL